MSFSDSHEDLTPAEAHGILLRLATDELEEGANKVAEESLFYMFEAEDMLWHLRKMRYTPSGHDSTEQR